jgi:outer membrane protein OmpA-like peptidoglycan-associated protein
MRICCFRRAISATCLSTVFAMFSNIAFAQTPPPLPPPIPFQEALLKAANDLFKNANLQDAPDKVTLVIDPLIDGVTGAQSTATRSMGRRITDLVKSSYPRFQIDRFTTTAIEKSPVVLIGTFTAINSGGVATGPRDAYRICLALADLKSRKLISKGFARALPEGVNSRPISFFNDSPVFAKDPATDGYVRSCQGTKAGDPIQQGYIEHIRVAALVSDAIEAYDGRKYKQALELYERAAKTDGGEQLRVLNGLYLANWRLNRKPAAEAAFGKIVDFGLKTDPDHRLTVKFLFRKNSSRFDRQDKEYPMWVRQIAQRTAKASRCLEIIGHTSATGPAALNDRLSQLRAEYVRDRIVEHAKGLHQRLITTGVGSRQMLVGTGKDDASDALDRRVEFKTINCS